jgi:hypothetical protein
MSGPDATTDALTILRQRIEQHVTGGTLDLAAVDVRGNVIEVLKRALAASAIPLRVTNIGWSADGTGVAVAGQAEFEHGSTSEVRATFTPTQDRPGLELSVILGEPVGWKAGTFPLNLEVTAFEFASVPGADFAMTVWARIIGGDEIRIPVTLELPGVNGEWLVNAEPGVVPLTLTALTKLLGLDSLAGEFPWALEAVGLTDLSLTYTPRQGLSFVCFTFATSAELVLVNGARLEQALVRVSIRQPTGARTTDLYLAGLVKVGPAKAFLEACRQQVDPGGPGKWTFRGSLYQVNLSALVENVAAQFDVALPPLPPELPELEFDEVFVEFTPADGSFTFHAETGQAMDFPRGGGISLSKASFTLSRVVADNAPTYPFTIQLEAKNQLPASSWPPGFAIKSLALEFSHSAGAWTAAGTLLADVFDATDVSLTAGYIQQDKSVITLQAQPGHVTLVQISALNAALSADDLSFSLTRTSSIDGKDATTKFDMHVAARLTVAGKIGLTGRLGVGDGGVELTFDAAGTPLAIPVPVSLGASEHSSVTLKNGSIAIVTALPGDGTHGWSFKGGLDARFTGFPSWIQQALPDKDVRATLTIDRRGFQLTTDDILTDRTIELPEMPMSHRHLDPWTVNIEKLTVAVDLTGGVTLSCQPSLTLPRGLNAALFGRTGTDANGPEREILLTGEKISSCLTIGTIGDSLGATFSFLKSPLKAFPFADNGKDWLLDLNSAGLVRIEVPRFAVGPNGFAASGGFVEDATRPLALPLTPVKNLLAAKFPAIAALLPEALPILRRPKLLSGGTLDVAALVRYLEVTLGAPLPEAEQAAFVGALQHLADAAARLPDRLKEYLEADLPSNLHFAIQAEPTGSVTADIRTLAPQTDGDTPLTSAQQLDPKQGGRPIMVLFPALPQLIGVRLSSLQMGPIFGGSLMLVRGNAEIDLFDPVVLAGSIAASQGAAFKSWLPDCAGAHSTWQLHDLVMFVVFETGIPIPVPIFYEKLGVDIAGPGDLELKASVSFNPLTHNDFAHVFETLSQLYEFVTTDARLDPAKGVQLDASIGETYLKLPSFLGAEVLGIEGKPVADADLSRVFASFLNGLKFFHLADLVAGIPLENRCGSANPQFGPLKLHGAWAATTRSEFTTGLAWSRHDMTRTNPLVGLSAAARADVLTVLDAAPRPGTDDGLFVLVAGEGKLGTLLTVDGQFVIVAAGRNGVATGLQLHGDVLAGSLAFKVTGSVRHDFTTAPGDITGGFTGDAILLVNGTATESASVTLSDEEISFSVAVNLFPQMEQITIKDRVTIRLSPGGFLATGNGALHLYGASMDGAVTVTDESFAITTHLNLPGDVVVHLCASTTNLAPAGHSSIQLSGAVDNLSPRVMAQAAIAVRHQINGQLREWIKWADAGYRADAEKWWWDQKHTLVKWDAYYAAYTTLAQLTEGTIVSVMLSEVQFAINRLPAPVAQGIESIINRIQMFDGLQITVDTSFGTALQGRVTLQTKGNYAGRPFGPVHVTVPLDVAQSPVVMVAEALATAVLA